MSPKQTIWLVVIALFAGFLGGIASQQVGRTVLAQAGPAEKVEAQEFRLVDAKGKLMGLIKATPAPSMEDEDGAVQIVPKFDSEGLGRRHNAGGGAIMLFDGKGQATWAAPDAIDSPARVRPLK